MRHLDIHFQACLISQFHEPT